MGKGEDGNEGKGNGSKWKKRHSGGEGGGREREEFCAVVIFP